MKLTEVTISKFYPVIYGLIAMGIVLAYSYAKVVMTAQTAWIWVVKSDITLNFVVLFFLYGVLCDKLTKHMPKKKGWLIWAAGMAILVLVLRAMGMSTIFG